MWAGQQQSIGMLHACSRRPENPSAVMCSWHAACAALTPDEGNPGDWLGELHPDLPNVRLQRSALHAQQLASSAVSRLVLLGGCSQGPQGHPRCCERSQREHHSAGLHHKVSLPAIQSAIIPLIGCDWRTVLKLTAAGAWHPGNRSDAGSARLESHAPARLAGDLLPGELHHGCCACVRAQQTYSAKAWSYMCGDGPILLCAEQRSHVAGFE